MANSSPPLCDCAQGFYPIYSNSFITSCEKCHDDCLSCSNLSGCETCNDLNAVASGAGCICKDGFWRDMTQQTIKCVECDSKCLTCDSYKCLTCVDTNSDPDNFCMCKDGYRERSGLGGFEGCEPCPQKCSTCNNLDSCLSCKSSLADGTDCKCLEGYWENYSNGIFKECSKCKKFFKNG